MTAPIVCYQGAAIVDPATDEVLDHRALENDIVRELIGITEHERMHLQLYRNDEYYCEARNQYSELYASPGPHRTRRRAVVARGVRI